MAPYRVSVTSIDDEVTTYSFETKADAFAFLTAQRKAVDVKLAVTFELQYVMVSAAPGGAIKESE